MRRSLSAVTLGALLLGGCLFDGDSSQYSLDSLWPSVDQAQWDFEIIRRDWADTGGAVYATAEDVPPCPTLQELAAILDSQPIGSVTQADTASWRFRFDGTVVTESGAVGQRAVTEFVLPGYPVPSPPEGALRPAAAVPPEAELWTRLAIARPDLREGLARMHPEWTSTRGVTGAQPLFLRGYAWEKTVAYIGGYGDLDRNLSWLYLDAPVRVDHEFTLQLVAALADDIFLHGLILPERTVQTPAGSFRAAVCLYVVDYGVMPYRDSMGEPLGVTRYFDYGIVAYAPGVGPVYSYERRLATVGSSPSIGQGDLTLSLKGRVVPRA